jgi:hypothetical protein
MWSHCPQTLLQKDTTVAKFDFFPGESSFAKQGCQIFLGTIYQHGKMDQFNTKYTKMAIKYIKWP